MGSPTWNTCPKNAQQGKKADVCQPAMCAKCSNSCREVRQLRGTQALPKFSCSCFEICCSTEPGTSMGWSRKKLKCQILSTKPKHHSPGPPTVGTTDEACGIWNKWQALCKPGVKATNSVPKAQVFCQSAQFSTEAGW